MKLAITKVLIQHSHIGRAIGFAAVSSALFLAPVKTDKVMVKTFNHGLSIQTAKSEPPRIAFNEVKNYIDNLSNSAHRPTRPGNPYENRSGINLNEKLDQAPSVKTVTLIRSQKVFLKPTLISRAQILEELKINHELIERQDTQKEIAAMSKAPDSKLIPDSNAWIDGLSVAQKNRLLAAEEKNSVLEQDWKAKTWQETLTEQISQQVKGASSGPMITNTSSGTVIMSSKLNPNAPITSSTTASNNAKNYLSGEVLLEPGLGLADGYIDIRHVRAGVALGAGKLKLPSNKYTIEVADPSGQIVATLYSGRGQKLGEGKIKVAQIDSMKPKTSLITISSIQSSFTTSSHDFTKTVAAFSKSKDYGDRGVQTQTYVPTLDVEVNSDDQGVAKVDNIIQDSWGLIRTHAEGYAPSLNLISAGPEKKKPIFRQKFIEALLSIAKDQQKKSEFEETNSVVWGQALLDGKPQAGVQVDVEFAEQYRPIYFNQFMIPDSSLRATSENGYYAILHLPEGFHSLVASRAQQYFSHANVQAEPETVFVANLETTLAIEKTEIKVFDAFSGVPGQAELEIQSLTEPLRVDGLAEVYLHDVERLSLMKVVPADVKYISQVQVYSDSGGDLRVALIEAAWLQKIQNQNRISSTPETSTVVGFVSDENYEVYLPHDENYSPQNIIYFDAAGSVSSSGVAGGGFIMFNVPQGTHSVVAAAKSTNAVHTQVVPVDPGTAAVLYFHF